MAFAALIISVLALLAAGLSVWYARSRAQHTRALARNDAARRIEERTPRVDVEVESVNDGNWYRLWARLLERGPLTKITVEIVEPDGVRFTAGVDGVDRNPAYEGRVAHAGPLLIGQKVAWRVEWDYNDPVPKNLRLKITCRGSDQDDRWVVGKLVDVPQPVEPSANWRDNF